MEIADKLIRKIDDELLKLHEASIHKGEYYHFNFKQALINLNREFLKNGLYDKSNYVNSNHGYEQIVRNYRDVFNDLSNSRAESIHFRYMSFDPNTGELEIEQITRNELNHTTKRELFKNSYYTFREPEEVADDEEEDLQAALNSVDKYLRADIIAANEAAEKAIIENEDEDKAEAAEAFKYYSNLKYPEDNYRELSRTCKFDYLLRDCSVKYDRLGIVNYSNQSDYYQFYFDNIDLFYMCLTNGGSFDLIFGHSFEVGFAPQFDLFRNKISFEIYIKSLQATRSIESDLKNDSDGVNNNNSLSENEIKEKLRLQREELIENAIQNISDKFISHRELKFLKELFSKNTTSESIIWLGTYDNLVTSVNEWYDKELISFPDNFGTKDFILRHFKMKKNNDRSDINIGSLNNAISKNGYRNS